MNYFGGQSIISVILQAKTPNIQTNCFTGAAVQSEKTEIKIKKYIKLIKYHSKKDR